MKDLNPDGIIGSHNTFAFQNGDLDIPIPLSTIKFSGANSFQDFDKKEILQKISNYKLSDDMKQFVKEYDRVFGHRDRFLWKWLGVIYGETGVTLSTIDDAYFDSITDAKIILTMAFSFLDDISEFYKDEQLLEKVMDIINSPVGSVDVNDEKLMFFRKIWNYFVNTINKYPRYEEFKDIFWYDFNQVLNSVRYTVLLNKNPEMMNLKEMQN